VNANAKAVFSRKQLAAALRIPDDVTIIRLSVTDDPEALQIFVASDRFDGRDPWTSDFDQTELPVVARREILP